jgi:hypothetical protein
MDSQIINPCYQMKLETDSERMSKERSEKEDTVLKG